MRAPPPHRKSKSVKFPIFFINIKKKLKCNDWKRRKRIHLLHRLHRKKYDNKFYTPLSSGLRVEDSFTLRTEYLQPDVIDKPLVIATFSNDCQELPTINILERSKLSRLRLMKRKFKLKLFNYNISKLPEIKGEDQNNIININNNNNNDNINININNNTNNFRCVNTVKSIKKLVEKDADIRVIFHNKNTIRSFPLKYSNTGKYEHIKFTKDGSLRIDSFASLAGHQDGTVNIRSFDEEIINIANEELTQMPHQNVESNKTTEKKHFRIYGPFNHSNKNKT